MDYFEAQRFATRRSKAEMRMPARHRTYLLMREAGLTRAEIREAAEAARKAARERRRTARGVRLGFVPPVEEALEGARRRIFKGGRSSAARATSPRSAAMTFGGHCV